MSRLLRLRKYHVVVDRMTLRVTMSAHLEHIIWHYISITRVFKSVIETLLLFDGDYTTVNTDNNIIPPTKSSMLVSWTSRLCIPDSPDFLELITITPNSGPLLDYVYIMYTWVIEFLGNDHNHPKHWSTILHIIIVVVPFWLKESKSTHKKEKFARC